MKRIMELKEIQRIELAILDYVVDICSQNNLRYFLAGGTLLGAVRHKGFIPWDNDIDIAMPRPDYDKFIDLLHENPNYRYKLFEIQDKNDYYYTFIKIVDSHTQINELTRLSKIANLGLYVDIFPIDGMKENREEAGKDLNFVNHWCQKIAYSVISMEGLSLFRKCTHMFWYILFQILGRERCMNHVTNRVRNNRYDESNMIASTFGLRGEKEIIPKKCFAQCVELQFENKLYQAPIGYDQYLKQMYGDYMQLPPMEQRVAPHDVEVYWKDGYDE